MPEHIESCTVGKVEGKPDHTDGTQHNFSGWPGAYCLLCGSPDANEICLGGCECPCHDQFWWEYGEYERNR